MGDEQRPLPGGRLEYAVLVAVWEGGTITARDVHDRVGVPLDLAYTTTARVLDRLHAKGLIARERIGKLFSYRAVAPRAEIDRAWLSRALSNVLVGDQRPAIATLVAAIDDLDSGLLDELTRAIAALRSSRREP
jgi:predicted transcriptional regulator